MNCEAYSRRDMGFQAVCIGYMLCKKYGVDTKNFAIDRIPDELKSKEPKEIKAELGRRRSKKSCPVSLMNSTVRSRNALRGRKGKNGEGI